MEQEKLAALVKMIMADPRIMALIGGSTAESGVLTLIETMERYESLPVEWKGNVFCQEQPEGGSGTICFEAAGKGSWKQVRIYQPSLNFIAKAASGIADEPVLVLLQDLIVAGPGTLELCDLCSVAGIKPEPYKKLFLRHLDTIRSFGIRICEGAASAAARELPAATAGQNTCSEPAGTILWQWKALTEKDLLDIEKGSVLSVGRKCIVTSLAVDMAKRKSIQICREGEVK